MDDVQAVIVALRRLVGVIRQESGGEPDEEQQRRVEVLERAATVLQQLSHEVRRLLDELAMEVCRGNPGPGDSIYVLLSGRHVPDGD